MTEYTKPMPMPDHVTSTFWDAARDGKLMLQRCPDCNEYQFFPQSYCRRCLSENLEWKESSGKGKVYTYTVVHRPPSAKFQDETPYTVALIELDEGVRMMSNIVGVSPDEVRVGMNVKVVFEEVTSMISLPKFKSV